MTMRMSSRPSWQMERPCKRSLLPLRHCAAGSVITAATGPSGHRAHTEARQVGRRDSRTVAMQKLQRAYASKLHGGSTTLILAMLYYVRVL